MTQTTGSGSQTLARGLDVVRAVADGADDLAEVMAATGLSRSTAHRLLQQLVAHGYVRQGLGKRYGLGPTLIEFGFRALHENPVPVVARPVLEELAGAVLDTVHLAIVDGEQVLYLDKIAGQRGAEMRSRIGHRMPLTSTGIGKALLLDDEGSWASTFAREQPEGDVAAFLAVMRGYAEAGATMDLEENEPGIRCVAAPVRDGSGGIVAAISVSATTPYMAVERLHGLAPSVRAAARRISRAVGWAE